MSKLLNINYMLPRNHIPTLMSLLSPAKTFFTSSKMKIAITGARGTVGREVINRSDQPHDGTPDSEMRTADAATDYDATVQALRDCDALIHLAAVPNPLGRPDWQTHHEKE
ncbi:hypothetical protein M406DRAFT_353650 [Cryphonectria parasitica EP155]|uniref:NAD-dependent epimerase/dehydratase domain-containing protein n=1 Tax=Cryphonectria parasitica (strain ATCC 38755 / EP155) TaxID=660469 RepID=A0A9P4XTK5_CRYP1|nr:uncharacterized protein M406DRAFT_353650 [Cryphonectria parasitica EP155]KAF3760987.1 hypothetical protein M406DRAFT_353650 [Cryphonectria parasitica EP155]